MALSFNGADIQSVSFNGADINAISFNGVIVWQKGGGGVTPKPPDFLSASDGTYSDRVLIVWSFSCINCFYKVYRDGTYIGETQGDLFFEDTNVNVDQEYTYAVKACFSDADETCSGFSMSDTGYASSSAPSEPPQTVPISLRASDGTSTIGVIISWTHSGEDNTPLVEIYRDDQYLDTVPSSTNIYFDNSVVQGTHYFYKARYKNANGAGNFSNEDEGWAEIGNFPVEIIRGMILIWSGSVVPPGWALCDGSNGTPDLRDKFIYGGDLSEIGQTGGYTDATLPAHTHSASFSGDQLPPHKHTVNLRLDFGDGVIEPTLVKYYNVESLPFSFESEEASAGTPTGTVTVSSEGIDPSYRNLPPYYRLAFIMKL